MEGNINVHRFMSLGMEMLIQKTRKATVNKSDKIKNEKGQILVF